MKHFDSILNDFAEILVSDNPSNYARWHHPEYDRIHALSLRTTDQAIRHELLGQLEALILEHTPVAPLFFRKFPYALHPSVKGWGNNALSVRGYKFLQLEPAQR
jgi:oligopeptide transport system substrate-binding protein